MYWCKLSYLVGVAVLLLTTTSGQSPDPESGPGTSPTSPASTADAQRRGRDYAGFVIGKEGKCPEDLMDPLLCPAHGGVDQCETDADCSGESKCCSTGCNKVCIQALLTACQHKKIATEKRWKMLEDDGVSDPVREERMLGLPPLPGCNSDGEFQQVQCNGLDEDCWCIDSMGFEMPGTRARSLDLVNCSQPRPCAGFMCRMLCPFGFELDADGCPLCECRDPCKGVRCPGNTKCQLKEVPCAKEPCPPVPTCKKARTLNDLCLTGPPLKMSETEKPFLCGTDPGKPECPPMFQCSVQPGHDYGVCCPAPDHIQKPGVCPAHVEGQVCGNPCTHDLECEGSTKCCSSDVCGGHCVEPNKMTACLQQKLIAELLLAKQEPGKGYVPQCHPQTGEFYPKQCSRNGMVCWCVDPDGRKWPRSFARADEVKCHQDGTTLSARPRSVCEPKRCTNTCEFGHILDEEGCPTCDCDDPCRGTECAPGTKCISMRDEKCTANIGADGDASACPVYHECRPVLRLRNPCTFGTPIMHEATGGLVTCYPGVMGCPGSSICTLDPETRDAVCCPPTNTIADTKPGTCPFLSDFRKSQMDCKATSECESDSDCGGKLKCCSLGDECGNVCAGPVVEEWDNYDLLALRHSEVDIGNPVVEPIISNIGNAKESAEISPAPEPVNVAENEPEEPTTCQMLREVGHSENARLAIPTPACTASGAYKETQCHDGECWCVDVFGVEIPHTRNDSSNVEDCVEYRKQHDCLGLRCRLGCSFGFKLGDDGCPLCDCLDICSAAQCPEGTHCVVAPVTCDRESGVCPTAPLCVSDVRLFDDVVSYPPACPFGDAYVVPILNKTVECKVEGDETFGCPSDYTCHTNPESDGKGVCCPKERTDMCSMPISDGLCADNDVEVERWSYDVVGNSCHKLMYTGCGGNLNNFADKRTCEKYCLKPESKPEVNNKAVISNTSVDTIAERKPNKPGQCPYLVPLDNGHCDITCNLDPDCEDTHKCCSNGCGTQCVPPLIMTACQHQRAVLDHSNRERGLPQSHAFLPRCDNDGFFETVQCDPRTNTCWCVDTTTGKELPGTRAAPGLRPNCVVRTPCPAVTCNLTCADGLELDERGCPICRCYDACRSVNCNEYSEECRLVQVNCITEPCPLIPMCLTKLRNPCVGGAPLIDPDNGQFVKCGPLAGQCPSSHKCHLSPFGEYAVCCPKPRETCFMDVETGKGKSVEEKWFFNPVVNKCDKFTYSGFGGNLNQFDSEADCRKTCPVLTKCEKMKEVNKDASAKFKTSMFIPNCDEKTGDWKPVQCMDEFGLCWCVDGEGKPVKGTMMRGIPQCSFRRSRMMLLANTIDDDLICPEGLVVHSCNKTLCNGLTCLAGGHDATCRVNPCGGCHPEFYDQLGNLVDCEHHSSKCLTEMQTVVNSPAYLNRWRTPNQIVPNVFGFPRQEPPIPLGIISDIKPRTYPTRATFVSGSIGRPTENIFALEEREASSENPLTSLIEMIAALLPKGPVFQQQAPLRAVPDRVSSLGTHLGMSEDHEHFTRQSGTPAVTIIKLKRKRRGVKMRDGVFDHEEAEFPDDLEAVESQMMVSAVLPTVKPGKCPPVPAPKIKKSNESCPDHCSHDGGCPYLKKCCTGECGLRCISPDLNIASKPGSCPKITSDVDFLKCIPHQQCDHDADCAGDSKCCYSGCGTKCLRPQVEVKENPLMYAYPYGCDRDLYFSPTQVQGQLSWCVDFRHGYPLHHTLTRGFVLCNREGQMVKRESIGPVCPNSNVEPKVCHLECLRVRCPAHPDAVCAADPCDDCRIRFLSPSGEEVRCEEKCSQPLAVGNCRAAIGRFYFNQEMNECQPFSYSGCGANDNNFATKKECEVDCLEKVEVCMQPRRTGMCRAHMTRWWYNPAAQRCQIFHYGGCGGNLNNFETKEACENTCPDVVLCPKLSENMLSEPCSRRAACANVSCDELPDSYCKVDPCTCTGQLVDFAGTPVKCPEPAGDTTEASTTEKVIPVETSEKMADESDEPDRKISFCQYLKERELKAEMGEVPECEENGLFKPTQCYRRQHGETPICWCVDDAGNRVPNVDEFPLGKFVCQRVPVESVLIQLGFENEVEIPAGSTADLESEISTILQEISSGEIQHSGVHFKQHEGMFKLEFLLTGGKMIDHASYIKRMVEDGELAVHLGSAELVADIEKSHFIHNTEAAFLNEVPQFLSSETHREMVYPPTTLETPYLAVIIVVAVLMCLILVALGVALFIYRRKITGSYPKSGKTSPSTASTTSTISSVSSGLAVNSPLYAYETKNQLARRFDDDYSYEHGRKFSITSTDGGPSYTHEYEVVTEADGKFGDDVHHGGLH